MTVDRRAASSGPGLIAEHPVTSRRIVLIEDDADLFELVTYNLTKDGYGVTGIQTGKDSL